MIKFFRNIRKILLFENEKSRYFKYAIGEIVLVVIGILIALQVNNWNETRKIKILESNYLTRLKEEAKWNIEQIEYNRGQYLEISRELNKAIFFLENNEEDTLGFNLTRPNYIHPWLLRTSTYNELITTGSLKIISDIYLRELLDEVRSYEKFSDQQLINWRNIAVEHESIFLPYKKSHTKIAKDSIYFEPYLDLENMKNDSIALELLKYWSKANIIFYEGIGGFQDIYVKIITRIECIEQNRDCLKESRSIIMN